MSSQRKTTLCRNRIRGFTLFELVMTVIIIGILAAASAPLLFGIFRQFDVSTAALSTEDKLRYATERMARELREVQNNAGTYAINMAAATVSTLSFTKNNGNTITLNGGALPTLTMADSGVAGTYTLTDGVTAVSFTGYQIDGTTTTNTQTNIAFVEITLTLGNFSQRTRVALRNQT